MSEGAEASGPPIQQESETESEEDSDTDFDPEEIEKEIMGVRSMLIRHCGRHKVLTKYNEVEMLWYNSSSSDSNRVFEIS